MTRLARHQTRSDRGNTAGPAQQLDVSDPGTSVLHDIDGPVFPSSEQRPRRNDCRVFLREDVDAGIDLVSIAEPGPILGRRHQIHDDVDPLLLHAKRRNLREGCRLDPADSSAKAPLDRPSARSPPQRRGGSQQRPCSVHRRRFRDRGDPRSPAMARRAGRSFRFLGQLSARRRRPGQSSSSFRTASRHPRGTEPARLASDSVHARQHDSGTPLRADRDLPAASRDRRALAPGRWMRRARPARACGRDQSWPDRFAPPPARLRALARSNAASAAPSLSSASRRLR